MAEAEKALEKEDYDSATTNLQFVVEKKGKSVIAPRALYMLTKISAETADYDAVAEYAKLFLEQYPQDEHASWIQYYQAEAFMHKGAMDEAEEIYKSLAEQKKDTELARRAEFGLATILKENNRLVDAQKALYSLSESDTVSADLKAEVESVLGDVNFSLLLSPQLAEGDTIYEVKKGEVLYNLARKFKITQELLMKANNITDPRMLKIGKQLKIPRGDFKIVVDKSNNTLTLYSGGKFFKKFRVRTGKYDYLTPTGDFKIEYKKKDPEWVDPKTHKRYGANDPENELGTRWMAFQGSALGIHGTIHPETIGQYSSQGCVGMLMEEVELLFDIVPEGTPVTIIGKTSDIKETESE